jgi:putative spermidine/putrescine transport system substrate-binding protein
LIGIPSPSANNGFLFDVMVAKLFGGSESDLSVAFKKLDELKPFVVAANPAQLAQLLETGEIALAVNWQTQTGPSLSKDPNLDFIIPEPGGAALTSCYTVLKKSANLQLAYKYINDSLSTTFQSKISESPWFFGPTNTSATIPPDTTKMNPPMKDIKKLMKFDWSVANKVRTDFTNEFIKRYGK